MKHLASGGYGTKTASMSGIEFWRDCSVTSVDPEVKHGRSVFAGTRMVVEDAILDVLANEEVGGLSEDEAIKRPLGSTGLSQGAEALRVVIAYDAAHEHLLVP